MKFSENWLRAYVNPDLDSDRLAHALTMAGLEVEALESVAPPFDKVVVGKVLSLEKHPDADRLNVCRVDAGVGEPLQIVCGAANVRAGAKVPCALVGAQLPKMAIKLAKVRGVESSGMLCSETELGLADESGGLLLLPPDATVGQSIRDTLGLDDKLYTLKLTPNRSDCLSVTGVAREVAAVTGAELNLPNAVVVPATIPDRIAVAVDEPAACPRYCGRVLKGLNAAAGTPEWMARRLKRSGLRPISAIVDVTNYVLLELGQPLHAFDLAKIQGGISVRFARPGEQLELLNGQTAALDSDMLVISDGAQALALAGVMGGQASAVSDATVNVFLESAFFSPDTIAGKARRLTLSTDSSYRFERGVDFASTRAALERATQLLLEICGGAAGEITEVTAELPQRAPIRLRVARVNQVLGIALSAAQIAALLSRLQFYFAEDGGVFQVTPPSYRFDLAIEADLIEEMARLYGYDNIPALPPTGSLNMLAQSEAARGRDALRALLTARDYQEVINYSFVDAAWERDIAGNDSPLPLKNPIASQMGVMRSTLFGGLIDNLRFNLNRKQERVRLFETGRCFNRLADGFNQPEKLAGLCYGNAKPEQWGEVVRAVDFYDAKADVEALFWPAVPRFEAASHPALHPGQAAKVWLEGEFLGWIGTLHPKWQQKYELPAAPVLFELELAVLLRGRVPAFVELSKFQAVRRDIAVVVDEGVSVQALLDGMSECLPDVVAELVLFDVYRGKGIDLGKKSLAFRVSMQDTLQTLTDEKVDAVTAQLAEVLTSRFGAKLRD
ncbi:MAG: phenylalanine--tRNA ligase subunit beta [Betaproteobacteria bacterium CG2_30_59_46]|nr:MAG: phenylalanine--tRNA ligase subunit beta [Betaproteobacteria bacterium CG2_30_59_46]PIQ14208.1 MAG: phenylalanine--tRNA ligase subunit beta [Hydrogenophilales bacterium CG18_big_fil_WC_8_21_14_2_50_58_12]PIX98893.1 MAG: phenylalanine--tRNA ligase subunit beta [Hydrogenophilales bacterium CG_4_10_14_3_um_filter_58_23]PJB05066.1 MAG: phenylalanine--tRNA ligase subunit beta [Hydrogenophilales bacterium CG_4_9_14_3_um_filter_59_35]